MQSIAKYTLGCRIRGRKVRAVFGRIGLDILASSRDVLPTQVELSQDELEKISCSWTIPYAVILRLVREFGTFRRDRKFFRTPYLEWGELNSYIRNYHYKTVVCNAGVHTVQCASTSHIRDLKEFVQDAQAYCVSQELGLPVTRPYDRDAWEKLQRWTKSRSDGIWDGRARLRALDLESDDIIAIRAMQKPDGKKMASLRTAENLMDLYPAFFETAIDKSIFKYIIMPGRTWGYTAWSNAHEILIHELAHSHSVLGTHDCKVFCRNGSRKPWGDLHGTCAKHQAKRQRKLEEASQIDHETPLMIVEESAYVDPMVFMLAARSDISNVNKAEDNAGSWAVFSRLRLLTLVYPEYNFIDSWQVTQRTALLHHCSLFDCLRSKGVMSVRNLRGYDSGKDPWSHRIPPGREELLEILVKMASENRTRELNEHLQKVRSDDGTSSSKGVNEKASLSVESQQHIRIEGGVDFAKVLSQNVKIANTKACTVKSKVSSRKMRTRAQKRRGALHEQRADIDYVVFTR